MLLQFTETKTAGASELCTPICAFSHREVRAGSGFCTTRCLDSRAARARPLWAVPYVHMVRPAYTSSMNMVFYMIFYLITNCLLDPCSPKDKKCKVIYEYSQTVDSSQMVDGFLLIWGNLLGGTVAPL